MLYLVGTPIGNLEDITLRALRVLKEADIIACEDTRNTQKLLNHYEITGKKLISYHEHNEDKMSDKIIEYLQENLEVALVTDAGMPCISDPGYTLVRKIKEVYKEQGKTVPVLMNFKTGILEVSNGKIELEITKDNKLYKIGKIKEKRKSSEEGYSDEILERYGRNK